MESNFATLYCCFWIPQNRLLKIFCGINKSSSKYRERDEKLCEEKRNWIKYQGQRTRTEHHQIIQHFQGYVFVRSEFFMASAKIRVDYYDLEWVIMRIHHLVSNLLKRVGINFVSLWQLLPVFLHEIWDNFWWNIINHQSDKLPIMQQLSHQIFIDIMYDVWAIQRNWSEKENNIIVTIFFSQISSTNSQKDEKDIVPNIHLARAKKSIFSIKLIYEHRNRNFFIVIRNGYRHGEH